MSREKRVALIATVMGDMGADDDGRQLPDRRIVIECRRDGDGQYRWYERESGADTEVSGASVADAKQACYHAWGDEQTWALRARWLER